MSEQSEASEVKEEVLSDITIKTSEGDHQAEETEHRTKYQKLLELVLKELNYEQKDGHIVVQSGTMENLTRYVILNADKDSGSTEAFVLTYRQFGLQPQDIFQYTMNLYKTAKEKNLLEGLRGLGHFLSLWVQAGSRIDFNRKVKGNLLSTLMAFLEGEGDTLRDMSNRVKLALIRAHSRIAQESFVKVSIARPNQDIAEESAEEKGFDRNRKLLDISAVALAEHLTATESKMYRSICPPELLNMAWKSAEKNTIARNVVELVERTNKVSFWVATEVCLCKDIKKRVAVMKKFIKVAHNCVQLNNFNTTMEILGGLNNVAVQRLKKAWSALPEKTQLLWNNLTTLMETKLNYQNYRSALQQCGSSGVPVVPFLGVFLRDLTFIEDGNPNTLESGHINFGKTQLLGAVIKDAQVFQQYSYHFRKQASIINYLRKAMVLPEDPDETLYELSLQVEPKADSQPTTE